MKKNLIFSLIGLSLISGNLSAADTTVTDSILAGQWASNCRYLAHSDPTDPAKGTHQKIYWSFTPSSASLSAQVSIHPASDKRCKQSSLFTAKAIYHYKLEGNTVLADNKEVTRISGKIIGENDLFDKNMQDILYLDNKRLYIGEEASGYPNKVDQSLFFSRK